MTERQAIRANQAKKSELLALPHVERGEEPGWWDALLIIPGRHKHDSGWAHIAIIGVKHRDGSDWASHILAYPDDIQLPAQSPISPRNLNYGALRTDAYHPSGVLRLWSREYEFSTGSPISSVEILIRGKGWSNG